MRILSRRLAVLVMSLQCSIAAAAAYESGPLPMPKARYGVEVERSVMVPMRDGVRLSTDVYMPKAAGAKLPAILIRLPYGKHRFFHPGRYRGAYEFAGQGYVVVVQEMRGTFQSEGAFQLGRDESDDSVDAAAWVAAQPWSNGNIGTYGCSYMASVQQQLAIAGSPYQKAMIPQAAFGSDDGGAVGLAALFGWARERGSQVYLKPPDGFPDFWAKYGDYFNPAPTLPSIDPFGLLETLPVIDIMKRAGAPPNAFETILPWLPVTTRSDPATERRRLEALARVPGLHFNSWFDAGAAQTLEQFSKLRALSGGPGIAPQFAIIGPGTHCTGAFLGIEEYTEATVIGERNFGDARFDFWSTYLAWFDRWLHGVRNDVESWPPLQIYVMGRNIWRAENEWPLARTRFTSFYLHSGGSANSRFGDGRLATDVPDAAQPADDFIYDPATPVPTLGGQALRMETLPIRDGAVDQSALETRADILVYTSEPIADGIEVTGPLELVLYVSSSAVDTDFTAKLVDVFPDGRAFNVQEGIRRMRYRQGNDKKALMTPGEITEVRISLNATSHWFAPGHRIRLEVSSSNFPRFDRNLNTGGNNYDETTWVVARNRVHHSAEYPSRLVLPVIPDGVKNR